MRIHVPRSLRDGAGQKEVSRAAAHQQEETGCHAPRFASVRLLRHWMYLRLQGLVLSVGGQYGTLPVFPGAC